MAQCTWSPLLTLTPTYRPFVFPWCHVTRRPCQRAIIPPCDVPHRPTVSSATTMLQPCRRATWCATVAPACHRASWSATVTPPCHLVRHSDTTVPPCRRAATGPTRHIGIPPYTYAPGIFHHLPNSCQSYLRTFWHCLTQFYHMVCCEKSPWLL